MAGPNASELFRSNMSGFADVSQSEDAAAEGFLANRAEPEVKAEEVASPEADAAATIEAGDEGVAEESASEPESPEEASDVVEVVEESDASASGDVVEMPDGTQVPVSELVRGHLRESDYTKKTTALAGERREFESVKQQVAAQSGEAMERVTTLAQQLEQQIARHQPTAQQMAELRQRDPAAAALMMEDQRRQQELVQAANQQAAYLQQQQAAQVIPQQRQALAQSVPAFEKDFDAEYQALGTYAISPDGGGLQREEWDQLVDHRHVTLVWKAKQYDEATRKARSIPKKLPSKTPKVLRPGVARDKRDTKKEGFAAALARQRESGGTVQSTAEAFLAKEQARRAR